MPNFPRGEIVIEIDHERVIHDDKLGDIPTGNSDVMFPFYTNPDGTNLRSRIEPARSQTGVHRVWLNVRTIPGQRIHVDPKAKRYRITDGLNDEENRLILEQVRKTYREANRQARALTGGQIVGYADKSGPLNTPQELHEWLFWMRRLVEDGKARILQGESDLPSLETLIAGGDIRIQGDPKIAFAENKSYVYKPPKKEEVAAAV